MRVYKCKCQICGKELTTDVAYKTKKGSRNAYYCSEEEFKKEQSLTENRDNCYYTAGRILRVPLITPSMKKEINSLSQYYDYIVIERTFKEQKEVIQRFLDRGSSNSEYAKMKYIMTIIQNNINKVHTAYISEQKAKKDLFKKSQQQTIDVDIMNSFINSNTTSTEITERKRDTSVSDISAWL